MYLLYLELLVQLSRQLYIKAKKYIFLLKIYKVVETKARQKKEKLNKLKQ